jgi:hypothetical protein
LIDTVRELTAQGAGLARVVDLALQLNQQAAAMIAAKNTGRMHQ